MKTDIKRLALYAAVGLVLVLIVVWFTTSGGSQSFSKSDEVAPPKTGNKAPRPDSGKR